jgi:hypothetical protein
MHVACVVWMLPGRLPDPYLHASGTVSSDVFRLKTVEYDPLPFHASTC